MSRLLSLCINGMGLASRIPGSCSHGTVQRIFNTKSTFNELKSATYAVNINQRNKSYTPQRDKGFQEIYRFRHITFTRLISRLKVYQTIFTIVASPGILYMNSVGILSKMDCNVFLGMTTFACLMLYVMSDFFRRIACVIYYNEKEQTVEISHMTFWAKRKDVRIDLTNLKPLSDTAEKKERTFVRLETYNQGDAFYLFVKHGLTNDPELLKRVIGL